MTHGTWLFLGVLGALLIGLGSALAIFNLIVGGDPWYVAEGAGVVIWAIIGLIYVREQSRNSPRAPFLLIALIALGLALIVVSLVSTSHVRTP